MRELTLNEIDTIVGGATVLSNLIVSICISAGTFAGFVGTINGVDKGPVGLIQAILVAPAGALWGFVLGGWGGLILTLPIELLSSLMNKKEVTVSSEFPA